MEKSEKLCYSVIDLFAGAGGLSEGFSAFQLYNGRRPFRTALAIEKHPSAHSTLLLRNFFKQFKPGETPSEYWAYSKGEMTRSELFSFYPNQFDRATNITRCMELGKNNRETVRLLIDQQLGSAKKWVLLGGPPCQVYSLAGRSRMQHAKLDFENDTRHFLYQEYLKVLADHKPPVFVFENVKGLLSATHSGERIIEKILEYLKNPDAAFGNLGSHPGYRLFSLTQKKHAAHLDPEDFLIKAEQYGIPQTRHRILILGIRGDIQILPEILTQNRAPSVAEIISDLPKIRSAVSREKDSFERWKQILKSVQTADWYLEGKMNGLLQTMNMIDQALKCIDRIDLTTGAEVLPYQGKFVSYDRWFRAGRQNFITHHTARKHMQFDLHRYLFASVYAVVNQRSPLLGDFPKSLLPLHQNLSSGVRQGFFDNRFRVQLRDRPSTTITSHIAKEGNYFIHPDPSQCRSLTVREVARLQTFPDNFIFEGSRTSQYKQVGNAVPPLLSMQVAEIVYDILKGIRE